jgi:hypothetical protein
MMATLMLVRPSRVIFSKIERAKNHIEDLQVASQAFFDSRPYEIIDERNPHTSERSYYLADVADIPDEIAAICGDALHNLRSALDHLAYQLVLAAGNTPTKRTAFPIADSATEYSSAPIRGKIKLMGQDAIRLIDALKPYKSGNDTLWHLKELDDIDKHRLLLTVGTRYEAHRATPSERHELMRRFVGSHPGQPTPNFNGMLLAVKDVRMLKRGDKLRTVPESEVEQDMQFHVNLAFNEPGVCEGEPVIDTLHQMAKLVGHIVLEFEPLLP